MLDAHDSAIDAPHSPHAHTLAVLHLVDPGSFGGGACSLRLAAQTIRRLNSVRHDVVVIGMKADVALTERCGLEPLGSLSLSRLIPLSGWRDLRRLVAELNETSGPYDLIHAWTARSALLASLAAPRTPRLATLHIGPTDGLLNWFLARQVRRHPMRLFAASSAIEQEHRGCGFDRNQLSLMPPAIDPTDSAMIDRATVRARWQSEAGIDPSMFVVGLLGEPVDWQDAMAAATIIARVALSGRTVRLVVHSSMAGRRQAMRLLNELSFDRVMIMDDAIAEPWRIVRGLDAALMMSGHAAANFQASHPERNGLARSSVWSTMLIGGDWNLRPPPSMLPLLWACAAGVPVIANDDDAVRGIVEHQVHGVLIKAGDVNAASDSIAKLIDDRSLGLRYAAAAESLVHDAFHIDAYCLRLKHAYELLLTDRSMRSVNAPGRARHMTSPLGLPLTTGLL